MKKNASFTPISPAQQRTFSCTQSPAITLLEAWCIMGGHWLTRTHTLHNRLIDETVLLACIEGKGWVKIARNLFPIKAGDIFCCPAGIPHSYGCEDGGWEIYWIHCQGRQVTALCEAAGLNAVTPVRSLARFPQVKDAFSVLIEGMGGGSDSHWVSARNLYTLLHSLVWLHHQPTGTQNLAALVHDECKSLDEIVKASGYSRFHFCRLFKKETGQTPWQYILNRKLEHARELLLGSQLSIKEIATRLGFNNPDYFARIFSRSSGVTPRHYRGRGCINIVKTSHNVQLHIIPDLAGK